MGTDPPASGFSPSESRRSLSGLEFFRLMIAGDVPPPPLVSFLGIRLLEAEEGRVVFGVTPVESHYNGLGVAHGGLAAALLDSALGCAINTTAPAGKFFTTLELKINYVRPITPAAGSLRCEARVIHVGSRVGTSEGRVVDANGKIYAHGTTTCIVVGEEKREK